MLGANIFLSSSGLIKIGDFGSAVKLKDALCTSVGEVFNTRGTAGKTKSSIICNCMQMPVFGNMYHFFISTLRCNLRAETSL